MRFIILITVLFSITQSVSAQIGVIPDSKTSPPKASPTIKTDEVPKVPLVDTVYYLLDTSKMPQMDRLWNLYRDDEYNIYGLNCHCYPGQSNAGFTHRSNRLGTIIKKEQLKKIRLTSLIDIIKFVAQYGANKIGPKIFYFIEPKGDDYSMSEVHLLWYRKPVTLY